jgi:two-component system cell cycle response regulator
VNSALRTGDNGPDSPALATQKLTVLVADDDPIYRKLLETSLRNWGLSVITAANGLEAWDILQMKEAPKLVILDWMMPGMDGIELCQKIRARKPAPYSYVLLLTSRDEKQDLLHGLKVGADDYLTKPFDANELRARLTTGSRILALQDALLESENQLRFEASHDRLTGLWNRGAILDFMERELARAQRSGQLLGLVMLDVDHFKKVNDTNGHQVGDVVLQAVAQRLAGAIRQYDWIGRYGGEEFLAIINAGINDDLAIVGERLRAAVADKPVHTQCGELNITISAGIAVSSLDARLDCDALVAAADQALYIAKHNGRNRIELADQGLAKSGQHAALAATAHSLDPRFLV